MTLNTGNNVLLFSLAEGSISVFCDDYGVGLQVHE